MSDYRKQHTVSEMLLKRFTNDEGKLYVFNKQTPKKGVHSASTKNKFWNTHFYSSYTNDGQRDVSLEKSFGKLESDTNPVIEKIVAAVRKGKNPNLAEEEKKTWDQFFCAQLIRTPDNMQKFDIEKILNRQIEKYIAKINTTRPLNSIERHIIKDPKLREQHKQKIKVGALKIGTPKFLEFLNNRGLCIAKITSLKKSFIIGSLPITKITYGNQNPFSDLIAGIWLPIAHDIAVTPYAEKGEEKLVSIDDRNIRKLNEAITRQSTIIAGRSEKLIRSLTFHGIPHSPFNPEADSVFSRHLKSIKHWWRRGESNPCLAFQYIDY